MIKLLFGSLFDRVNEFLTGVVTELTFIAICAAGLVFVIFSLLFGGDDGDVGADGDAADGHDGSDGHDHGPGVLSLRGISLLAIGFGATGFLVFNYTGKPLVASVAGLASGWVFAFLCMLMLRAFMRQESNSLLNSSAVVGSIGVVTTSILENGFGEVMLTVEGRQLSRVARAEGGEYVPLGTQVSVLTSAGGTIVVAPTTKRLSA